MYLATVSVEFSMTISMKGYLPFIGGCTLKTCGFSTMPPTSPHFSHQVVNWLNNHFLGTQTGLGHQQSQLYVSTFSSHELSYFFPKGMNQRKCLGYRRMGLWRPDQLLRANPENSFVKDVHLTSLCRKCVELMVVWSYFEKKYVEQCASHHNKIRNFVKQNKETTNSMVWVHERTIPTERTPLVCEVIANFCR
jgi:hypothetical protein